MLNQARFLVNDDVTSCLHTHRLDGLGSKYHCNIGENSLVLKLGLFRRCVTLALHREDAAGGSRCYGLLGPGCTERLF
jgi:hypothetical protein